MSEIRFEWPAHESVAEVEEEAEDEALEGLLRPTRIVCIGGGTGLPAVLRGLVRYVEPQASHRGVALTAVVAVSDDGGSSGRLRRQTGILPPGDVRNCLVALGSGPQRAMGRVFQHRFRHGDGPLRGHALGNLVLTALTQSTGDFLEAVRISGQMLGVRGLVLPCTLRPITLRAELEDGRVVRGERNLVRARGRVRRLDLDPSRPPPTPGLLAAIRAADLVVLGPGSLYTSLLPNLLVDGVVEALQQTRALRVMVGNLMVQPGETDGMDGAAHVGAVFEHAGPILDCVLVNDEPIPPLLLARYGARGASPVHFDRQAVGRLGIVPIGRDVLNVRGARIRHHARKLGDVLLALAWASRQQRCASA